MSEFIPDEIFEKSVSEKDISAIKTCLINFIHFDPIFQTSDFNDALEYVMNNSVYLAASYKKEIDEYKLEDPKDWSSKYFFLLTEWLRRNFAVKERMPHIIEVGQVAFKERLSSKEENDIKTEKNEATLIEENKIAQKKSSVRKVSGTSQQKKKAIINLAKVTLTTGMMIAAGVMLNLGMGIVGVLLIVIGLVTMKTL